MRTRKRLRRGISLGTLVMLICTIGVLAGFAALMPSFTGNQDIFIDAARLAVAIDESLSQLTISAEDLVQKHIAPQSTFVPPFANQQNTVNQTSIPDPTPLPTPTISPKHSFSLCAAGTIELDSSVRKALTFEQSERYDLLTDQVHHALKADLSIVTLQNTFSNSNDLSNVNMPSSFLDAISQSGVNHVNLGHINIFNYGKAGLEETAQAVDSAAMTAFGIQPTYETLNGIKLAILHYQNQLSSTGQKKVSKEERSSLLAPIELSKITADISDARNQGAQIVIVTLNWGPAGKHDPTDEQIVQAQAIADAGADIILGTGNGALQPVQVLSANRGDGKYHPTLCAYSLGNLFSPNRESRVTLSSILLKTDIVYDTASNTVAFENLSYTPTYAWRGKDEGKTIQRILINNPDNAPAFVDDNQLGVMERSLTLVTNVMKDTAIPLSY